MLQRIIDSFKSFCLLDSLRTDNELINSVGEYLSVGR